jgi:hypothetical protein
LQLYANVSSEDKCVFCTQHLLAWPEKMMNIRIIAVLLVVGTAPSPTFASTDGSGLTREQVHEELIQLRAAGYDQSQGEDTNYPVELQAALARVEAPAQVRR